jgi:hypothetical protein
MFIQGVTAELIAYFPVIREGPHRTLRVKLLEAAAISCYAMLSEIKEITQTPRSTSRQQGDIISLLLFF